MRKIIDMQMEFWKIDIANIEFDLQSRDEITKPLMGLQHIYCSPPIREKVFAVLNQVVPKKNHETGWPGMDLWKILVLGTLRLYCNWDYDKVHEIANNHNKLRRMLGHRANDFDSEYALQTIRDNIALLTPQISKPYYLNADGWVVEVIGGKFALDAYKNEVFFHVQFNPGIDPANIELKHISRFSSIKNYDTQGKKHLNPYLEAWKKQGVKTPSSTAKTSSVSGGSISSGEVFLNPAVIKDAKIIQKRLSEMGFYNMKVDGALGNGSKKSLGNFKKSNGLANDSVWDLKTQKALFKGSGL